MTNIVMLTDPHSVGDGFRVDEVPDHVIVGGPVFEEAILGHKAGELKPAAEQ
jgi:hypothetical protein